jgi:serine/threonine protein phosphatase PrpC
LRKSAAEAYGSYGGSFSDTTKKSKSSLRWEIGAVSECGVRESNEDAYLIANDLLTAFESSSYGTVPQTTWREEKTDHSVGLFGIFDGHCGDQGARFAVEQLGRFIHDELEGESIEDANRGNKNDGSSLSPMKMESILREAIVKLDVAFCNLCQEESREWESGATALVAMIANENLVIASLGDCRGFLCRFVDDAESYVSDDCWEQLEMDSDDLGQHSPKSSIESESFQHCFWREVTTVHSPSADKERTRIENANGWITTETEIPFQLRRMDWNDEDVIGILQRCCYHPSRSSSFNDSERSIKECNAAPQRIIHISRVCGELAVSRALGDRDFKADFNCASTQPSDGVDFDETKEDSSFDDTSLWESPLFLPYPENHNRQFRGDLITNTPDFHRIQLGTEGVSNEFLLLACDGLWDVMDADDAIRVVRDLFRKKVTAKKAAARLAELAIHLGSSDNITVVLLRLFSRDDAE